MTVADDAFEAIRRMSIFEPPTSFVGNSAETAQAMLNLIREAADDIAHRFPWDVLRREHTFTTTATEAQSSGVPSDYGYIIPDTFWNRSERAQVRGPISPVEWQRLKATINTQVYDIFTIRNGTMYFMEAPDAGETCAYEYITDEWFEDSGGTGKTSITADSDVFRLDRELMILSLVWRYKASKGLDYREDFQKYQLAMAQHMGHDGGGAATVDFVNENLQRSPYGIFIPEGAWPIV